MTAPVRPHRPAGPTCPAGTLGGERKGLVEQVALVAFIAVPFLAILLAVPVAWGGWLGWPTCVLVVRLLRRRRPRHHGRLPPLLHPRLVQGQAAAAGRPRRRRQPGHRGPGHPLGGRPPQAPQVLRQGGRPALAVALRRDRAGADQGPLVRPHGLAVRRRADPSRGSSPPTCSPTRTSSGSAGPSRALALVSLAAAGRARRPDDLVLAGRADRVLLGQPGPHRPAAPRHLVDQLDLPRHRRAAVREPRPVRQRLVAGRAVDGRVLAQPAPRRPDLRPHGVLRGPDRLQRPGDLALRGVGWAYDVRWPKQERLDARRAA